MLSHMRTTINLPDHLYRAVRVKAAEEGRTVTSLLEEALRALLEDSVEEQSEYRVDPLRGAPVPAEVDIDDNVAMRDLMDGSAATQ
jgi:plasmid stability protein